MNSIDRAKEDRESCGQSGCDRCGLIKALLDAVGCLEDLTNELTEGRNLGKSWSEYQVTDSVIENARAALLRLRGGG